MNRSFLIIGHAAALVDHMEMKEKPDFMNDAMNVVTEWLAASRVWLELESARLTLEAETRLWEAENSVFSGEAGCYDWEFIDEWL